MSTTNPDFIALVATFHSSGMVQLGKVANPFTGKVERDLQAVKQTVDILAMLEEKTRGNLSEDESRFLEHALYELRMNYLDESQHPASAVPDKDQPGQA